jgi:hypothetical protein
MLEYIRIYVFDNSDSQHIVDNSSLPIIYKKNPTNIGGNPNILQAYTVPTGKYIWTIGDDELLPQNSINTILQHLLTSSPNLILNIRNYNSFEDLPVYFPSYQSFASFASIHNPHLLIAHSLISTNIILKSTFVPSLSIEKMNTQYGNFYATVKGQILDPGPVIIPNVSTLTIRPQRPDVSNQLPLTDAQTEYLTWLRDQLNLPITPSQVVPDYNRRLFRSTFFFSPFSASKTFLFSLHTELFSSSPFLRPSLSYLKTLYYKL